MTTTRRGILFVATDLGGGGGVNRVIRDLAAVLAERGEEPVRVEAMRSRREPSFPFPDTVEVVRHADGGRSRYWQRLWALRRAPPRVAIGSWAQDNVLLLLALAGTGTRCIVVEHCSWDEQPWPVKLARRLAYRWADAVVVLNRAEEARYRRFLGRRAVLLPNPVALPVFSANSRTKRIVAVGHLIDRKNFAAAIAAMARSGLEADGWSLDIIGEGPERHALEAQASRAGLKRVRILASTDRLSDVFADASMMLVTSTHEVFSLVLAEGMAAGVISLAFAADGPQYLLEDHPDLLVPMGDVGALAGAMRAAAGRHGDERLRQSLRHAIEERFAPDRIADRWLALIDGQA